MPKSEERNLRVIAEGYLTDAWRTLGSGFGPFLAPKLRKDDLADSKDVAVLLRLINHNWEAHFGKILLWRNKQLVKNLIRFRNDHWAHQGDYSLDDIRATLGDIVVLLQRIDERHRADVVRRDCDAVGRMIEGGPAGGFVPSQVAGQIIHPDSHVNMVSNQGAKQAEPIEHEPSVTAAPQFFTDISPVRRQAMVHHQRGNDHLFQGEYHDAIEEYDIAILIMSTSAESYFMRAIAKAYLGDDQGAVEDVGHAISNNPSFDRNILQSAELLREGRKALRAGNIMEGLDHYDAILRSNPDLGLAYNHRGIAYGWQDRLNDAIREFHRAIGINPYYANAYLNLARHHAKARQYDLAIDSFHKAIEIDPNNARAWYEQGDAYYKIRNNEQAITSFSNAVSIDPTHQRARRSLRDARSRLGRYHENLRQFDEAIAVYRQMLEGDWRDADAWFALGEIYGEQGNHAEAIQCFAQTTLLDPDNPLMWAHLGEACLRVGDYRRSAEGLQRVVKLSPDDDVSLANLGIACLRMGEFDRAISYLSRAVELNGGWDVDPETMPLSHLDTMYLHLGDAYGFDDQPTEAILCYQRSIEFDDAKTDFSDMAGLSQVGIPTRALAWHNMSVSYLRLADYDEAVVSLNRAIEEGLDDPESWLHLANLQFTCGDHEQALNNCQRVMEESGGDDVVQRARDLAELIQNPVSQFDKGISESPDDPDAWHLRGLYLFELGEFEKAISDFSKAICLVLLPGRFVRI